MLKKQTKVNMTQTKTHSKILKLLTESDWSISEILSSSFETRLTDKIMEVFKQEQDNLLERVEKMIKKEGLTPEEQSNEYSNIAVQFARGYNQAVDDLKAKLEELKRDYEKI